MEKINVESHVSECFVKCAHVILGSRIYRSITTRTDRRARKWFLLEIDEVEPAVKEADQWRKDLSHPLVIEIFMSSWRGQATQTQPPDASDKAAAGELLLERWTLQYDRAQAAPAAVPGHLRSTNDEAAVYKRMILLVRSLYSYVRILPAYRMFRASKRHNRPLYQVEFRILKSLPRQQHRHLEKFAFAPVDTSTGSFSLSVEYQPAAMVHIVEQATSPSLTPRIIPDYVGAQQQRDGLPAARLLRHAVSASVYDERMLPDPSCSPPISSGAGILRGARGPPVVRHSWSSKEIQAHTVGATRGPDHALPPSLPNRTFSLDRHNPHNHPYAARFSPSPSPSLTPSPPPHDILLSASPEPPSPSLQDQPRPLEPPRNTPPRVASLGDGVAEVGGVLGPVPSGVITEAGLERVVSPLQGVVGAGGVISPFFTQQQSDGAAEARGALWGAPRSAFDSSGKPPNLGFQASAPVTIPGGGRHRARSVTDLSGLEDFTAEMPQQAQAPSPINYPIAPKASTSAPPTAIGTLSAAFCRPGSNLRPDPAAAPMQHPHRHHHHHAHPHHVHHSPHQLQMDEDTTEEGLGMQAGSPGVGSARGGTAGTGAPAGVAGATPPGSAEPGAASRQASRRPAAAAGTSPYPPTLDPSGPPNLVRASTSSEASSSTSSAFPMSCSPQLPFAFTPSTHSLASFAEQHAMFLTHQHHAGVAARPAPSPPNPNLISGRDISALATIRRPSWGSRSSSFDVGGGAAPQFSVSMSPLQDMLDSSIMSTSTPRRFFQYSPNSSPALRPAPSGGSFTQPGKGLPPELEQQSLPAEESESDILPFALDENTPNTADSSRLLLDVFPFATGTSTTSLASHERDDSVTSFLRKMTEALDSPPIRRSRLPLTVGEALNQLQMLTGRIQAIVTYE